MGVAFGATIVSLRADEPGSCASKDGCSFSNEAIAAGIDAARVAGASVINLSLGGSSPSPGLLAAMQRATNAGIILVISAGNDGTVNPDPFALGAATHSPGMVIIAGSVGVDNGSGGTDINTISSFSNKAGTGQDWYMVALGYMDRAPDQNGTQYLWSGTSFSAPVISGAVALLKQAFPKLTGAQIVKILFDTADDLGVAGIDKIYGHGRLNIARAFQPIGTTTLAGSQVEVSAVNNGDLPPASGDAGGDKTGTSAGAVILDQYDRAFNLDLAKTMRRADPGSPLAKALLGDMRSGFVTAGAVAADLTVHQDRGLKLGFGTERLGVGPQDARRAKLVAAAAVARIDSKTAIAFGFSQGAKAMQRRLAGIDAGAFLVARDTIGETGFGAQRGESLALRRQFGKLGVTVSGETGKVWQDVPTRANGAPYRMATISVDREFGSNLVTASLTHLDEKDSLLGGRMAEALAGGGSATRFVDLEARRNLGQGWTLSLGARRGFTSFSGNRLETSGYSAQLIKYGLVSDDDSFGIRIAQPLRVEKGGMSLYLPTSYSYDTAMAGWDWQQMSLVPSGREFDGELGYGFRFLDGKASLSGNLFYRRQAGHIAAASDDKGAAIRFTLGF